MCASVTASCRAAASCRRTHPVAIEHARAIGSKPRQAQAIVTTVHNTPFGDIVTEHLQRSFRFRTNLRALVSPAA